MNIINCIYSNYICIQVPVITITMFPSKDVYMYHKVRKSNVLSTIYFSPNDYIIVFG